MDVPMAPVDLRAHAVCGCMHPGNGTVRDHITLEDKTLPTTTAQSHP